VCAAAARRAGETPLFFAARGEHLEMVQRLIECGADPTVASNKGTVGLSKLTPATSFTTF